MWGKGEYQNLKFNDLKQFSRPREMNISQKIDAAFVGYDHCLLKTTEGKLWGVGTNQNGCLGTSDGKKRITPVPLHFYNQQSLRIIDIACGQNFTVVIAEKYET